MNLIFVAALVVLTIIPAIFVIHRVYQDGLIGRLFLLLISFTSSTFLLELVAGDTGLDDFDVLPQTAALTAGFAGFMCWHLWKFHRRLLRGPLS